MIRMLKSPCEIVVKYFLPACRSLIAKELVETYGLTQVATAKKLGTTQATISHYLLSKRGEKHIKQLENNALTKSAINIIAKDLATETFPSSNITQKLCDLCTVLRHNGLICTIHKSYSSLSDTCDSCLIVPTVKT